MKACINGSWLAYDDIGYGPAVILIHSFPLSRQMWQLQLEFLSDQGFRVIAPDLRGFGESRSHVQFDLAALTDDVCRLMSYLGIGRAVMVGISSACGLLIDMLERYPQRVAASCFLSPVSRPEVSGEQVDRFNLVELVRGGHRKHAIDTLCEHLISGPPTPARQRLTVQLRSWMQAADTHALLEVLERHLERFNISPGESSSPIPSMVLADTGPLASLETPEEVNRHLLGFLKQLHSIKLQHHRLQRVA
jgi:pimeloyl-ACP methyl ester carboxylesterase